LNFSRKALFFGALFVVIGVILGGILVLCDLRLIGGAVALIGLGPLFWAIDHKLNPALLAGPASYAYLFHFLGYVVGPLGGHYFSVHEHRFSALGMGYSQWGALLGLLAFAMVYPFVFRISERVARPATGTELKPGDRRWTMYTAFLGIAALAILVYAHFNSAFRRLGDFESPTTEVQTLAAAFASVQEVVFFFLALIAAWHRRRTYVLLWLGVILTYGAYTILEGTRGLSITAVFISGLGFAVGGLSKRRVLLALACTFVVFMPLVGIVDHYRSTSTYASQYDEGFVARTKAFYSAAADFQSVDRADAPSALDVWYTAITAATVDRIMEDTPDRVPFAGFRDLDRIAYVWTPKVLDPDRPSLSDGNSIAMEYDVGHDGVRSWSYTPTVGEGYRRFGWIGIPLVYGLLGAVFGTFAGASWARRRQREWAALVVFLFLHAPSIWSSTLLSLAHFALWEFPKSFVFFYALRRLQDFIAGLRHREFSRAWAIPRKLHGTQTD
jgi:hypothetical protein